MRKPFDLEFYKSHPDCKVETRGGRPVRIICTDKKSDMNNKKIIALLNDGNSEHAEYYTEKGTVYDNTPVGGDLFIVTDEPELTEFEAELSDIVEYCKKNGKNVVSDYAKRHAKGLLSIAREQLIKDGAVFESRVTIVNNSTEKAETELTEFECNVKTCVTENLTVHTKEMSFGISIDNDTTKKLASELLSFAREQLIHEGYIIEKKAFHDAVEKVEPEAMKKEVSANLDLTNFVHDLGEKYPEVSFAKLTRIAKAAYDYGKTEALKDLPRWRTIEEVTTKRTEDNDCVTTEPLLIKGWIDNDDYRIVKLDCMVNRNMLCIPVRELTKLPGFKEE